MRAAIVAFNNLRVSPYVRIYSDYLDGVGVEYDLIYLDRDGTAEQLGTCSYPITYNKGQHKLSNFLRFAREAKKILKRGAYDFVFVMPTMPSVLLSGFLKRKYSGRYLVDVRDPTYEKNPIYFALEKKVMKHAAMRVISSLGYKKILPEADYVFCPNVSASERVPRYSFTGAVEKGKIRIAYVGYISYTEACRKMIEHVLRDDRFYLDFYGIEAHEGVVSGYVRDAACDRITYHGAYTPSEKGDIIMGVDVLFNAYNVKCNPAFPNKLYDSMYFKKPNLCDYDSALFLECDKYAYPVNYGDEGLLDGIYEWYSELDGESYDAFANAYLERAYADLDYFYERLRKTVFGEDK